MARWWSGKEEVEVEDMVRCWSGKEEVEVELSARATTECYRTLSETG